MHVVHTRDGIKMWGRIFSFLDALSPGRGGLIGSLRSPDLSRQVGRLAIIWVRQPTYRLKTVSRLTAATEYSY